MDDYDAIIRADQDKEKMNFTPRSKASSRIPVRIFYENGKYVAETKTGVRIDKAIINIPPAYTVRFNEFYGVLNERTGVVEDVFTPDSVPDVWRQKFDAFIGKNPMPPADDHKEYYIQKILFYKNLSVDEQVSKKPRENAVEIGPGRHKIVISDGLVSMSSGSASVKLSDAGFSSTAKTVAYNNMNPKNFSIGNLVIEPVQGFLASTILTPVKPFSLRYWDNSLRFFAALLGIYVIIKHME